MLKKYKYIFTLLAFLALPLSALSNQQQVIDKYITDSALVGQKSFYKYLFHVYDVKLFAPEGKFDESKPFALSLTYQMNIKGKDIAERSILEMKTQGFSDEKKLAEWKELMENIFPDVSKGTNLTGIYTNKKATIFLKNGVEIGRTSDKDFGKRFFGIWLSEKTSEPEMRKKLLGNNGR